ncbi:MAG: tetratricopeptide repeat protein [Prevotellaceae bacterium]|nr:tetratricopeptide repeat protein [Prevotellaceae bacterium]
MKKLLVSLVLATFAGHTFAQMTLEQISGLIKSDPKTAQKEATKFFKKNKKDTDAIIALGNVFADAKDFASAEDIAQKALAMNPKDAKVHMFLGDLHYMQDDGGAAASEYEQAVNANPTDTTAYVKYANIYKDKFADQAKAMLERMGQNCQGVNTKRLIADMYYRGNHPAEAAKAYAECDMSTLTESDLANYVFSLSLGAKDFNKAIEVCEEAGTKYPENVAFKRFEIYNLTDLKKYEEADSLATTFFANEKFEKSFLDYIYYGYALKGVKKYDEALGAFSKAYEMNDKRVDALSAIADVYSYMDNPTKAIEYYKQYMDKSGSSKGTEIAQLGNYYFELAQDFSQAGNEADCVTNAQEADKYFVQAIDKTPSFYMNYLYRGRNAMLYDKTAALEYLNKSLELSNGSAPQGVVNLINKYIKQCTPEEEGAETAPTE